MADKQVIAASLTLENEQASKSVKSFKAELKEATNELLNIRTKFGELSPEALAAAKRVAELKDNIKDAAEVTNLFDPGAKFQVLGNVVRTVAGGFSALTGTMALLGIESEDTAKTLAKVQAALALSEGLNTIVDAAKDFERLGAVIKSTTIFQKANEAATKAAAFTQRLFGGAVDQTSTSFKVLKGAIAATGIGLLLVGIGELISLMSEWTSATEKQIEAQNQLKESTTKLADAGLKAEQDFISRQEKLDIARAKARGATEEEIFKIQQTWQQTRINSQKRHHEEIYKVDEVAGQDSLRQIKNFETDKEIQRLNFETERRKKAEEEEKKRLEKAKQAQEKILAEEKAAREKFIQERQSNEQQAQSQIQKLRLENELALIKDEDERRKQRIIKETEFERERLANLNLSAQTRLELLRQINANEVIELDKLEQERKEKSAQHDKDRLQAGLDRTLAAMKSFAEERKKDAEEQQAIDRAVFDNKAALADATAGVLSGLSELFGRQTAAGKVAALAQIAINTAVGFVQGLRIAQQSAAAAGPGAAFVFPVFYATQIAAVLAAASRAKAVLSSGNSGGTASTASAPSVSQQAPLTPAPQTVNTTIDQQSVNDIGNAAAGGVNSIRAFVVESDSAAAAQRAARLAGAAVLGG